MLPNLNNSQPKQRKIKFLLPLLILLFIVTSFGILNFFGITQLVSDAFYFYLSAGDISQVAGEYTVRIAQSGGTWISTGAILGGGRNPRWFYVSTDNGATWQPTYSGSQYRSLAQGKLMNARLINAIVAGPVASGMPAFQPEANTNDFIDSLSFLKSHGILAVTVGMQGGAPGYTVPAGQMSGFSASGSLDSGWLSRLAQVIEAANSRGMIVIVSYFYQVQDDIFTSLSSVEAAVDNMTDWLINRGYRNVIIEIANEHNHSGMNPLIHDNISALVTRAKNSLINANHRLPVSASGSLRSNLSNVGDSIINGSDLIIFHGNNTDPSQEVSVINNNFINSTVVTGPIIMNEDDNNSPATGQHRKDAYNSWRTGTQPDTIYLNNDYLQIDKDSATGLFQNRSSWGLHWWPYNQYYYYHNHSNTSAYSFGWDPGSQVGFTNEANYYLALLCHVQSLTYNNASSDCPSAPTPTLTVTASANPASIQVGNNSTLTATASNGTTPYTYQWSNSQTGSTITVTPAVTTTYTVTVTDAANNTASAQVTVTVGSTPPVCNNDGTCDAPTETTANCPNDCPSNPNCNNNGTCEASLGETSANCSGDCPSLPPGTTLSSDFNHDNLVDIKDFGIMLSFWAKVSNLSVTIPANSATRSVDVAPCDPVLQNRGDSIIDISDVALLLSCWGTVTTGCCSEICNNDGHCDSPTETNANCPNDCPLCNNNCFCDASENASSCPNDCPTPPQPTGCQPVLAPTLTSPSTDAIPNTLYAYRPSVATDSQGNVYLIYINNYNCGCKNAIYYMRYDVASQTWGSPYILTGSESLPAGYQIDTRYRGRPDVAIDNQDTLHIVWTAINPSVANQGAATKVYYSYLPNGGTWSSVVFEETPYGGERRQCKIAVDQNNVWITMRRRFGDCAGGEKLNDYVVFRKANDNNISSSWRTMTMVPQECSKYRGNIDSLGNGRAIVSLSGGSSYCGYGECDANSCHRVASLVGRCNESDGDVAGRSGTEFYVAVPDNPGGGNYVCHAVFRGSSSVEAFCGNQFHIDSIDIDNSGYLYLLATSPQEHGDEIDYSGYRTNWPLSQYYGILNTTNNTKVRDYTNISGSAINTGDGYVTAVGNRAFAVWSDWNDGYLHWRWLSP